MVPFVAVGPELENFDAGIIALFVNACEKICFGKAVGGRKERIGLAALPTEVLPEMLLQEHPIRAAAQSSPDSVGGAVVDGAVQDLRLIFSADGVDFKVSVEKCAAVDAVMAFKTPGKACSTSSCKLWVNPKDGGACCRWCLLLSNLWRCYFHLHRRALWRGMALRWEGDELGRRGRAGWDDIAQRRV